MSYCKLGERHVLKLNQRINTIKRVVYNRFLIAIKTSDLCLKKNCRLFKETMEKYLNFIFPLNVRLCFIMSF